MAINMILPANCGPLASGVNMGRFTVKSREMSAIISQWVHVHRGWRELECVSI